MRITRHRTSAMKQISVCAVQSVMHQANLDVRFEHPKSALNVSQTLVTLHHLSRCGVDHQQ